MKRIALLLTAALLAGCASTDTPAPASYAPLPVTYGPGSMSLDAIENPPMRLPYAPLRTQSVDVYVHQAPGPVPMLQPQVLPPLRPVTLQYLN
jgi:hypothetical protein